MRQLIVLLLLLQSVAAQTATVTAPAGELARGRQLLNAQKFNEAAAVFGALTTANPADGQAWFFLGYARHAAGELEPALAAHLTAVKLGFNVSGAAYNAACAQALLGRESEALDSLEKAWQTGFADLANLRADSDLASLREHPRYLAVTDFLSETNAGKTTALGEVSTVGELMPGIGGGMVVADDGTMFVADFKTRIWKMAPDGTREVFAEGIDVSSGIALDSRGRVIQSAFKSGEVLRFSPSGDEREVLATGIPGPVGLFVDTDDRIYVTSCHSSSVHTISPEGELSLVASSPLFSCANGITRDESGNLYVCNWDDGLVLRIDPQGAVTPLASLPGVNNGHITYRHGALWVAAMTANQLYRVSLEGEIHRIAGTGAAGGDDGAGLASTLYRPNAMAFDRAGSTLYWNDQTAYQADSAAKGASIVRKLVLREDG